MANEGKIEDKQRVNKAKWKKILRDITQITVLILSILLIVYISYDTFADIPYFRNHDYMMFQFWVCMAFLGVFLIDLIIADKKWDYFKNNFFFLLISIPYVNIISKLNIHLTDGEIYYLRFVPLIRGIYAMVMVLRFISQNRAMSLLIQYGAILVSMVYTMTLVFFAEEHPVNPDVKTFWDALYWAAMNTVTIGSSIPAMTVAGKIISVILPIGGMLLIPMFTVCITNWIQNFNASAKASQSANDQTTLSNEPADSGNIQSQVKS